jgi:hypothetical protein
MIDTDKDKAIRCGQWLKGAVKEIPWDDHRCQAIAAIDELLRQCGVDVPSALMPNGRTERQPPGCAHDGTKNV